MRFLFFFLVFLLVPGGNKEEKDSSPARLPLKTEVDSLDVVQGIDVSFYQKDIRWGRIKNVHFVFIKATEGTSISDPMFERNWDSSKEYGILRGAYHFYRPYTSAEDQFNHFRSRVKLVRGDLPPVLDVEVNHKYPSHIRREALVWLKLAEDHYGVKPIIYCSYFYYKKHLNFPEFDSYPLWIANYIVEDINTIFSDWHFWQYTSTGRMDGIQGNVDRNVFYGPYDSLLVLCKR